MTFGRDSLVNMSARAKGLFGARLHLVVKS
jgi:hypothetical protein